MPVEFIFALIATGIAVGFASGLLGIGGCFIMIPVQIWVFTAMDIPMDVAVKLAFGTNLLVVLPTAVSGAWGHSRRGAVWWRAGLILGGFGALGALIGSTIATHVPGEVLKIIFGAAILIGALRMLTARPPKVEDELKEKPWLWVAWGFPMGIVTGLIGIGGGILMIPVMVLALRFKMHQAVGTSTAMMILTSVGGLIGYIVNGWGVADLPAYSAGYVNIPTWAMLAGASIIMAQVGVRVAHRLPARQLRWAFIAVMFYVALKMIGVFGWLGWPI